MVIIINPMEILWAIRHPDEDMTSAYATKMAKVSVLVQLLKEIILLAVLFDLSIHQGLSATHVGYHLDH
jgi:hypothetical protein